MTTRTNQHTDAKDLVGQMAQDEPEDYGPDTGEEDTQQQQDTWGTSDNTELYEEVAQMNHHNEIDRKSKEPKRQSMLNQTECTITKCSVKTERDQLQKQLTDLQQTLYDKTAKLENMQKALQNKIPEEKQEELYVQSIKSAEVQSLNQDNRRKRAHIQNLQEQLNTKDEKIKELTEEKKDFLTSYELDRKYAQKHKQLKNMEQRINMMLSRQQELEANIHKLQTWYDKVVEAYNEKVRELKLTQKKIKDLKLVGKNGIRLTPANDKKPNLLKRLFHKTTQ